MLDAINIYYKDIICEIGGIETMTYNLAAKYKDKDILFLFESIHPQQLVRLLELGSVVQTYRKNRTYRCKRCFVTLDREIPENIIAEEYIRIGHNNFDILQELGYWKPPKDLEKGSYYAVAKGAMPSVEHLTGKKCGYCPNPYLPMDPKPLLKLVSPQRMSTEKGPQRMKYMAQELDKHGIPFIWTVITNNPNAVKALDNKSFVYLESRLDIASYVKDADYLVLLSDAEGSPMAVQEALMMGVPVVCTDLHWVEELDIRDKGFFVKLDMSDLDVEEIYRKKGTFKFKWEPPKDIWGELLLDGTVERDESEIMKIYKVKATKEAETRGIVIAESGGIPKEGQEFKVSEDRIDALANGNNRWGLKFVEVIEEAERPKTTENKPKTEAKKTRKKKTE